MLQFQGCTHSEHLRSANYAYDDLPKRKLHLGEGTSDLGTGVHPSQIPGLDGIEVELGPDNKPRIIKEEL